jgi:hypothetical protein
MAAWLGPALKAVLPHIGTIVSAVMPVFTSRRADSAGEQLQLLQEQITELQYATSQNAEYIKDLAVQLQSTVTGLEQLAVIAESKIRRAYLFSISAFILSLIAVFVAVLLLLMK